MTDPLAAAVTAHSEARAARRELDVASARRAAAIAATTREESELLWDLARTRRATADHYAALAR